MHDDAELLRRYVEDRSEDAFTELVQRHLGLVYSVAVRRVGGDAHLAEDVAQKIFTDLARKASSLRGHATLSGWHYVGTHVASAEIVRRESRRKNREAAAHVMQTILSESTPPTDWDRVRPALDDLVLDLRNDDREAIVQRFFQQRTYAEIGAALRLSEEAARKRVDRSLEKLRALLVRRGITSTTAALGLALAASGSGAVPTGLVAHVSSTAIAHSTTTLAAFFSTFSSVVVPIAAALVLGAVTILPLRHANESAAADIARLTRENQSIATLRFETNRLAADLASARDLERATAELPALRARLASLPRSAPPATVANVTTVTPDGRLIWNGSPVTLDEYLHNLRTLQQTSANQDIVFLIRANGGKLPQMFYALDEARKAGIKRIVVESDDTFVQPFAQLSWF